MFVRPRILVSFRTPFPLRNEADSVKIVQFSKYIRQEILIV
jgi:hypothetical protein